MNPAVAAGPGSLEEVRPPFAGAPSVLIRADARPESGTEVEIGGWSGPLGLLLTLIESRQLDILGVPLGNLAEAYLEALGTVKADRLGHISSFVAVAGQLILIKSRAMLPRPMDIPEAVATGDEGDDPETDLRARLLLYRVYRDAARTLADAATGLFHREAAAALASGIAGAAGATPPRPLDPAILPAALAELVKVVMPPTPPPQTLAREVTLAERAAIIRAALRRAPQVVLQDILERARDRVVVAVTFLAMLELMKRREIVVEQAVPFGPIIARSTTPE